MAVAGKDGYDRLCEVQRADAKRVHCLTKGLVS